MAMEASLEMQFHSAQQDRKLEQILDTLLSNGVSGAAAAKSHLHKTQLTYTNKTKQEIQELFKQYDEPLCLPEHWVQILNHVQRETRERKKARIQEKAYSSALADLQTETPRVITVTGANNQQAYSFLREVDPAPIAPELTDDMSNSFDMERTSQTREFGRTLAFNPYTGDTLPIPLQYSNVVSLEVFKKNLHLIFYPLTEVLNIEETLKATMKHAQFIGYSRRQYSTFLRLLLAKTKPSYAHILEDVPEDDEEGVLETVLDTYNSNDLSTVIRTQLKSFSRKPEDNIRESYKMYLSLVTTKLKVECPHLTQEKIKSRAKRQALMVLPDLLAPSCKQSYENWLKRRRLAGEEVETEDALKHIQDLENTIEANRLQEEAFPSKEVSVAEVSLMATEMQEELGIFLNRSGLQPNPNPPSRGRGRGRGQGRTGGGRGGRGGRGGGGNNSNNNNNNHNSHNNNHNNDSPRQRDRSRSRGPGRRSNTPYHPRGANNNVNNNTNNHPHNNSNNNNGKKKNKNNEAGAGSVNNNKKKANKADLFCEKCNKTNHDSESCYTYTGPVMPGQCRWCRQGRHHSDSCKNNNSNNNNQTNNNNRPGNNQKKTGNEKNV